MRPSVRATFSGDCVMHLFMTGVFSITKICVVPELAMASFVFSVTLAAARACVGIVGVDDILEVMMVMLSLSISNVVVAWVGYKVVLAELTQNE